MRNTYKIIWTDEALNNLKAIINYLELNWSLKEIKKFARLLDKQLVRIKNNPFFFAEANLTSPTRRSVLTKQITIYDRIIYEIQIITLFENRQNPNKLKKL